MAESATILISDISGYTDFVVRTELDHSAQILNDLLETIVQSVSNDFVVSEIEGDAVLLYKKGSPPAKKDIIEQCVKTFSAFHCAARNEWANSLCQCGACQNVANLTLKFVIHYGTIAEINVARFVKASGTDMVIAHRLLKNNISGHEYVLTTDSYLKNIPDSDAKGNLNWMAAKEEYPSLGVIEFHFASLTPVKQMLPLVEPPETTAIPLTGRDVIESEIEINVSHFDVHEALLNIVKRRRWMEGVTGGEGDPYLSVGSKYVFMLGNAGLEIEPRHVESGPEEIIYEEYATNAEIHYYAIYRFYIKSLGKHRTLISYSVFPQTGHIFSEAVKETTLHDIKVSLRNLKSICEEDDHRK